MSEQIQSQSSKPTGPWSLPLLEISGIPIRVHFTFLLFLAWIGLAHGGMSGVVWIAFIISIFVCVLLHELGHAIVCQRMGIPTRHITLYPLGGVALLDGRPKPKQELFIALAGPAVNFLIAAILTPIVLMTSGRIDTSTNLETRNGFLSALLIANLTLGLFNLIPAFPMDGGRVLRAVLNLKKSERRATQIAAAVGQVLAIGLGFLAAANSNIILFIVAAFVFLGAGQELSATVTRSFLEGHTIAEAMQIRLRTIQSGSSMDEAAKLLIEDSQHDFPVVVGEQVVGVLTRNAIVRGLAGEGTSGFVAGQMLREFKRAEPSLALEEAASLFSQGDTSPILVMSGDELVGMLTSEHLSEFIVVEHARSRSHRA
jgi:Zn-dependent protease/CBS domain-containing protein